MKIMGIDPGTRNCGFVILDGDEEDSFPLHWGGWFEYDEYSGHKRTAAIVSGLQTVADFYGVHAVVTEEFYHPHGANMAKMAQANYQRGGFDALLWTAFGHLHFLTVHPSHLKKFATGNGNAPKVRGPKTGSKLTVLEGLDKRLAGPRLDYLKKCFAESQQQHVIEAWGLAEIGRLLWQDRWVSADLPPKERDTFRAIAKRKGESAWTPPVLGRPCIMPMFHIPVASFTGQG